MIETHLTEQQVEAYRRRALPASERSAFDRHLAACDDCLRRVIDATHPQTALAALTEALLPAADEEPFHLSHEELKRYAAGGLDQADRVIFESHLEDCVECGTNARELVLISSDGATRQGARANGEPVSVRERFKDSRWRLPSLRPAHLVGIALVCVGVLLGAIWLQSRFSGERNQPAPSQRASRAEEQNQPLTPSGEPHSDNQPPTESASSDEIKIDDAIANRNSTASQQKQSGAVPEISASLIDDNRQVTLDKSGHLTGLEGLDSSIRREVSRALSGHGLKRPDSLDALTAPRITLLDQSSTALPFGLLSPVGRIIVADRPTFHWQPLSGASSYTVSVFDSNFNRVMRSETQHATEWSPPIPLQHGKIYFWEVTALKDGQEITSPVAPAPRAQFKIVEVEKLVEINQVKRAYPDSHLALGIVYARAGLLEDAEREFQLLAKANPRSQVARRLLRRVQAWKKR